MNSYYIDTNVFARYILGDVPNQFVKASVFFQKIEESKIEGKLSILVINELVWILEKYYEMDRKDYIPKLLKLLHLKGIRIIEVDKKVIINTLDKFSKYKFDLTDIYLFEIVGKDKIMSFDKDFEKIASLATK